MEESKEENLVKEEKKINLTEKIRNNPWILSTLIAGVLVIVLLISNFSGGITGKAISANEAGENLINYLNKIADSEVKLVDIKDIGSMYEITVEYQEKNFPIYVTKDGLYYTSTLFPLTLESENLENEELSQNIPKLDKPKVELFVMSFCPYGTQAEKGIIPVVKVLGNSIDFYVRFVYYAMHPSYGEVEEQLNQYCIQEEQRDKYLNYLECFLEDGNGEKCLNEAKIDKTKLSSCTSKADKQFEAMKNLNDESLWLNGRYPLFNINKDLNEKYGVQGSPTLVINEQEVSSGRSPADYLDVVCQAFNDDKVPETCSTKLSTSSYSPGFGYSESTSSSTTAQCG